MKLPFRSEAKPEQTITVTNRTVLRIVLVVVGTLLFLDFLGSITKPLTLIFIAFFLALALNPIVSWIATRLKSKSRTRATGAAYLIVLSILGGFIALVVPPLVGQTTNFIREVPTTIANYKDKDTSLTKFIRENNIDDQIDKFNADLSNRIGDFTGPVFTTAGRVVGTLASIIIVLVLTFMMLVEGPLWVERILALQPAERREHRRKLINRMYRVVTGYVNGQLLIAVIGGIFAFVVLLIMTTIFNASVNAVALAGIVTVFGLIPMIGNTLAAIVVVLFCLFASAPLAIAMAVYFIIYQQIENVTLQPYIQAKSNQLTPLVVFVAALIGAGFGGLLGALVAIPIAGCLKILVEERLSRELPTQQQIASK